MAFAAGRSTESLAIIQVRHQLLLVIFGALTTLSALAQQPLPPTFYPHATWTGGDATETITIDLRADGKCTFSLLTRATNSTERVACTYWIHGGRVRLRARGQRLGQGLNKLEIEHLRELDELVILGDTPKTLTRTFPNL
jgi:hypothetical protein